MGISLKQCIVDSYNNLEAPPRGYDRAVTQALLARQQRACDNTPTPSPEIPAVLSSLRRQQDELEELVGKLEERLRPVMAPPPSRNATAEPPFGYTTELGRAIGEVYARIVVTCGVVRDLTEALQV